MSRDRIDPSLTPEQLREMARGSMKSREESWERSDTDGFLSQWALGLTANWYEAEARIRENGGVAEFPALFSRSNPSYRIPAKLIHTNPPWAPWTTQSCWAIVDPSTGKFTGQFITAFLGERGQKKHNIIEGREMAPAHAEIQSRGRGLSGTAWVGVVRDDGGYPH